MRYLSVFSGIESASVAWSALGWSAVAFAEIEPFCCAVLAHHYPDVPNLGDVNEHQDWPRAVVDVLVGGSPCQSFSVAGLRRGLADPRGNLALVYLAIADRYRPRWLVWENVPGVLSSGGGRDFGAFIGGLVELGYGISWRVLDAQYVRTYGFRRAVPQRRRRVFVVGYLGDWRRAAALLFERESLCWHHPPRRTAGQGASPTLDARADAGGAGWGDGLAVDLRNGAVDGVGMTLQAGGQGCERGRCLNALPHVIGTMQSGGTPNGHGAAGVNAQLVDAGYLIPVNVPDIVSQAVSSKWFKGSSGPAGDEAINLITVADPLCANEQRTYTHEGSNNFRMRNVVPVAFAENSRAELRLENGDGSISGALKVDGGKPGQSYPVIFDGGYRGESNQTDSSPLLRRVRDEIGAEAFAEWGLGILDTLQPEKVLRSRLHGSELRPAAFSRNWVVYCALAREKACAEGALQSLWEAQRDRRSSPGRQSSEQLAGELGAYLSGLSQPGAQAERFMRDLWMAGEGLGPLRQALSAIQEIRQPAADQNQPTHAGLRVRRLTPREAEFLQGLPRDYTLVPYHGRLAKDGPRYRAIGNAMACNVMRWLGRRIEMVEGLP